VFTTLPQLRYGSSLFQAPPPFSLPCRTCNVNSVTSAGLLLVVSATTSVMAGLAAGLDSANVTTRPCCCQATMVGEGKDDAETPGAAADGATDAAAAGAAAGATEPPRMEASGSCGQ
jgi:hypothetical protein